MAQPFLACDLNILNLWFGFASMNILTWNMSEHFGIVYIKVKVL
jgi:hypothetical protein